jgi:hypothetical protein
MSDIARSPVFIDYMNKLAFRREVGTGDLLRQVNKGATNGLRLLLRILTEGTPENRETGLSIKIKVAQDLLDREDSAPRVSRSQATRKEIGIHFTSEDVEKLKRRAFAR